MQARFNFVMVLALLVALVGASATPAHGQSGISSIAPLEGTVGSQITLSGSGFGQKQGEVLLGAEKCRVLAWSDAEITCEVFKPQHAGAYAVTVLPQGDKQPAAPMTFSYFFMRRPHIMRGELVRDGDRVTLAGAFLGDKKGEVRLTDGAGGKTENAGVVDWSMDSICFELPPGLTGEFVLIVGNDVGEAYARLNLAVDPPLLEQVPDPPGWGGEDADDNASGVYYKGKFYVFTIEEEYLWQDDNFNIGMRTFDPGSGAFANVGFPKGKTTSSVVPLVIEDTLWVFYTGLSGSQTKSAGSLFYQRYTYDESTGTGVWADSGTEHKILTLVTNQDYEIAPVYDPINHRIIVYYEYQHYINWVTSDDYGATWVAKGQLNAASKTLSTQDGPSAIYYHDPTYGPTALVAFIDSSGTGNVVIVSTVDGKLQPRGANGYILNNGSGWTGRPFLVDLGSGEMNFAVLWGDSNNTPWIVKFNGTWQPAYQAVHLPDVSGWLAEYYFQWRPNAAINDVSDGSGGHVRHLYLFYGVDYYSSYGYWLYPEWMMYDMETLP